MLGVRFNRATPISSLEQRQKHPTQSGKGVRGLGWLLLLGSLVMVGRGVALAEAQLEVGTSTTLSPQAAPPVLPSPPVGVRQISLDTDPEQTADMPLSLMAEQVLEAVCEAQIDAQRALALMPDLSESHIRAACPKRLIPKS
ncbi:MAG TPA: hypothetical protein IGR15_05990 [Synechococcus sp. M44_DOE_062]|nr:hypothetical protein [Synechococcus sp. M44_DOE_062]